MVDGASAGIVLEPWYYGTRQKNKRRPMVGAESVQERTEMPKTRMEVWNSMALMLSSTGEDRLFDRHRRVAPCGRETRFAAPIREPAVRLFVRCGRVVYIR